METPDFTLLGAEEAAQAAVRLTAKQFETQLPHFSPEQLQATLPRLTSEHDPHWQAKVGVLLQGVAQRKALEAIGRTITPQQTAELLESCADAEPLVRDRMQFILVGLRQPFFEVLLHQVSNVQLSVLRSLGNTESLQHHLTLLVHELARQAEEYALGLEDLERRIDSYDVHSVRQADIDDFLHQLQHASSYFLEGLHTIDTSLGLAWNTTRQDLIERLTQLKESWQRYLQFGIGRPGSKDRPATALYQKLEQRLSGIFGNEERLADNDPAIEGLAALSLWVLEDYWQMGLLPKIANTTDLELDPNTHSEKECALYKERLTATAQENLQAVGLKTVGDLKREHIYSSNMLKRYVQHHHELLT